MPLAQELLFLCRRRSRRGRRRSGFLSGRRSVGIGGPSATAWRRIAVVGRTVLEHLGVLAERIPRGVVGGGLAENLPGSEDIVVDLVHHQLVFRSALRVS